MNFKDEEGFSKIIDNETLLKNKASLNIAQYVSNVTINTHTLSLYDAIHAWEESGKSLKNSMNELFEIVK